MNNLPTIDEITNSSIKEEELEQILIYLGLRDELYQNFLSRGLNTIEKLIEIDNYNLNKNILSESKKILILKNVSLIFEKINFIFNNEENEENSTEVLIIDIIRDTHYFIEGIKLTKDILIKGFKVKSKPNSCLPIHFQEKNISSEIISASVLSSKKIIAFQQLEGFNNLMYLYLQDNKIQKIEELNFVNLIYLDLSNNLIRKIENLENLKKLEYLNLEKNCISVIENLNFNNQLEYLNISKQYLTRKQNIFILENFVSEENKISTILLDLNNIYDISSLGILVFLKKLSLNDNKIYEFNLILDVLKNIKNLEYLTVYKNPFIEKLKNYRDILVLQNKNLQDLDEKIVTENERNYVTSLYHLKYGKNKKNKTNEDKDKDFKNKSNKVLIDLDLRINKMEINEDTKNDYKLSFVDNTQIFKRNKVLTNKNKK